MRNSRGVEVKRGYYVWDVSGLEGTVIKVTPKGFVEIQVDKNGNRYQYGTVIDNIVQVLPPMRVMKDGTVKANPINEARELFLYALNNWDTMQRINALGAATPARAWLNVSQTAARQYSSEHGNGAAKWKEIFTDDDVRVVAAMLREHFEELRSNPLQRVKINSPSQLTGEPPSARLKKRRRKTAAMPIPGIWANPLTRVSINSLSQRARKTATGGKTKRPSKRLVDRREYTEAMPAGFYANPARVISRFANVENDGGFSFGMDDRTPVAFVFTDRERKGKHWYTSFRLPDELIASEAFQQWIHERHGRVVASLSELRRMLRPFVNK